MPIVLAEALEEAHETLPELARIVIAVLDRYLPPSLQHLVLLITAFLVSAYIILVCLDKVLDFWKKHISPRFQKAETRDRVRNRQLVARSLRTLIERINIQERWRDDEFVELEAEVETEGRRRPSVTLPFYKHEIISIRRERSLANALRKSTERLIVVEGEP